MTPRTLVAILGPTASGKSALGVALAERHGGEVVSCDSTAVYRGFDIGTDKVSAEERRGVAHHLVDVADPTEEYSAARVRARGVGGHSGHHAPAARLPILVGGTGFYYRALARGLFAGPGRDAAMRARLARDRAPARPRAAPPAAGLRRSSFGCPHPAARREADDSRAGGLLSHRPSAHGSLRGDRPRRSRSTRSPASC